MYFDVYLKEGVKIVTYVGGAETLPYTNDPVVLDN